MQSCRKWAPTAAGSLALQWGAEGGQGMQGRPGRCGSTAARAQLAEAGRGALLLLPLLPTRLWRQMEIYHCLHHHVHALDIARYLRE